MQEHTQHPCDSFLQQWNLRREVANYYFTALSRCSQCSGTATRIERKAVCGTTLPKTRCGSAAKLLSRA